MASLVLGVTGLGVNMIALWAMLSDSVPAFVAPLCLAIGLTLIFVALILLVVRAVRRRPNGRIVPSNRAKERDTELLIEVRECAGWIKECLTDPLFNNLEMLGAFKRTQQLSDLRTRLSHHPKIAGAMLKFRYAAAELESAKGNRAELQERLISAHRDLIEEIGRII